MLIESHNPKGVFSSPGNYSQVVAVTIPGVKFLYLAGQVGLDSNKKLVGDTVESQTRAAFENVKTILNDQGGTLRNIVRMKIYLIDMTTRDEYLKVQKEYFREYFPSNTLLEVKGLARPYFLVEIEVTAVVEDKSSYQE